MTALTFTRQHHYEKIKTWYEGTDSLFYEAFDTLEQRKVGIKQVKLNRELLKAAEQEARALHKLSMQTTRVPSLYATYYDQSSESYYLIMQLIEGGSTLEEQLRFKLSLSLAMDLAIKLCDVLAEVHQCRIQHRDLKPANIIVRNKEIYLIDFNLSFVKPANGQGTPIYQAPEQRKLSVIGLDRIDIFSFGVVLYEMITGTPPLFVTDYYNHEGDAGWRRFVPPSAKLEGLPAQLDPLVQKCMAFQPNQRYSSISQVKQALIQLKRGIR